MDAPLPCSVKTEIPSHSSLDKTPSRSDANTRSAYMCRKCRVHGKNIPVKRHKRVCPYKECPCHGCKLVDNGRLIVAKQIALYREQKVTNGGPVSPVGRLGSPPCLNPGPSTPSTSMNSHYLGIASSVVDFATSSAMIRDTGPHCRKCRNHGLINAWKGHKKKCLYQDCKCSACYLISQRKDNEKCLRDIEARSLQGGPHPDRTECHLPENHMTKMMSAPGFGINPLNMSPPQPAGYPYNPTITTGHPPTWTSQAMCPNPTGYWDTKITTQNTTIPYAPHNYNPMVIAPNHFSQQHWTPFY